MRAEKKLKRKNQGNPRAKEKQDSLTQAKLSGESEPKPIEQRRRTGGGVFKGNCFKCGQEGHRSFECLIGRIVSIVSEVEVQDSQTKKGEILLA